MNNPHSNKLTVNTAYTTNPSENNNNTNNSKPGIEESKRGTPSSSDNSLEEEEEGEFVNIGSPIAVMWYEFLMQPRSSNYAMMWSLTMCSLVFLRIIGILMESCNGPNQYYQRDIERANYYFLLTEPQYFQLYIACFTPLLFDTVMRVILILLIAFEPENYPVYQRFVSDRTEVVMFVCDVVCVIPFLVCAATVSPRDFLSLSQASSITLSIMELLMTCRIFRVLRNIPAIRAVSIALTNSFEHLVLPIFFFFAFNITTGVFFYFAEPCYDVNACPWTSLFQSSFFSIVAMTTTGYGNQVPGFIISRTVAVSVMLFGSLYLSMPLAIIGNEYDKAWNQVQDEEEALRQQRQAEQLNELLAAEQLLDQGDRDKLGDKEGEGGGSGHSSVLLPVVMGLGLSGMFPLKKMMSSEKKVNPLSNSRVSSPPAPNTLNNPPPAPKTAEESALQVKKALFATSAEEKRSRVRFSAVMVIRSSLIDKLHHLHSQYKAHSRFIAPSVMIGICELRAWLPTLVLGIEEVLRNVTLFESRILSLKHETATAIIQHNHIQQQQQLINNNNNNSSSAANPSNSTSNPNPAPAAGPERRRYSVIGRGGAVISRSNGPSPHLNLAPIPTPAQTNTQNATNNYSNTNTNTYTPSQHQHHPGGYSSLLPAAIMRASAGREALPPLMESSRKGSNHNHNHHSSHNSNNNSRRNSNSSDLDKRRNSHHKHHNNHNSHRKHSNSHSPHKKDREENEEEDNNEEDEGDEDEEEESELGSLGSFLFSSDFEFDDDDFADVEGDVSTPASALPVPLPSLQVSSSIASSSNSNTHNTNNNHNSHNHSNNNSNHSNISPRQPMTISEEGKSESDDSDRDSMDDSKVDVEAGTGAGNGNKMSNRRQFISVQKAEIGSKKDNDNDFSEESRKVSLTRQSLLAEAFAISRKRARTSMYNRLVSMLKSQDADLRRRTLSEEAVERLKDVAQDPSKLRNRLWILLEFPHSSREARALQILLIFLICLSIFIMYTQTITSLTLYGESQPICGSLLELYCWDKDDKSLDPGCFVQNQHGPTDSRLRFDCETAECYSHGLNFGSGHTNMTCQNNSTLPFQTSQQLQYTYGNPLFFTSRNMMQRISAVCSRIECTDNSVGYYDASPLWISTEFVMNSIFLLELVLRVAVTQSLRHYVKDVMNFFDLLAILPFLLSIIILNKGSISSIDFSILASSPYNFTIVLSRAFLVFRLFKLTRHFRASKVLFETAKIVWRQILGMLALLALMVLLFSIILYELERGNACYAGDPGCVIPEQISSSVRPGDLIYVGKKGLPSQFGNIFYGVWFSYVTATTTGFGDIVPVTNGGQIMSIFLMLFGTFYMAMPLTAAATTFYNVHERHASLGAVTPDSQKQDNENNNNGDNGAVTVIPSFNNTNSNAPPSLLPPPRQTMRKPSIISDGMKTQMQSTIRDLRTFDRLLEEVITDLHSSPICFFDEALMRQEERKYSLNSDAFDTFSNLDDVSSIKSGTSLSTSAKTNLSPPRQLQKMRKNIAKLCRGLEDVMRGNEDSIVDLVFLHHSILQGDLD